MLRNVFPTLKFTEGEAIQNEVLMKFNWFSLVTRVGRATVLLLANKTHKSLYIACACSCELSLNYLALRNLYKLIIYKLNRVTSPQLLL